MAHNRKSSVTEDQHAHHKRILKTLLADASLGNKVCADCHGRQPTWASVNLGAFVCLTCSGIHRSLGVHVSQVRSTTLDTWTPEQVVFVQNVGGNTRCNGFWEAELDRHFVRPDGSNVHDLKRFIVDKYVNRRYVRRDIGEKVRRMGTDAFGRYYAGEMVCSQGDGEGRADEPRAAAAPTTAHLAVDDIKRPSQREDDLLLLDVTDDSPDALETARKAQVDDVWGDIEWISGEEALATEEANEIIGDTQCLTAREQIVTASTTSKDNKKSVDDILALFDNL